MVAQNGPQGVRMLYELLAADDGLFRLFNYTTFRTGGAVVTAFLFSVLEGVCREKG